MPGLLCAAIALPILPASGAQADRNIPLFSKSVPLGPQDGDRYRDRVGSGALLYRGGLAIRSTYRRFGGQSGLVVSSDGKRLTAISDRGVWLRARIRYDAAGRLVGLADGRIGPLHDPIGIGPHVHRSPDRAGRHAVLVVVEAHQAGLRDRYLSGVEAVERAAARTANRLAGWTPMPRR